MPADPQPGSPDDWLRHARSDLALARSRKGRDVLYEHLCFHAQQAAEKAIKKGLNPPAAFFHAQEIAKQLKLPFYKLCVGVMLSGWKTVKQLSYMANGFHAIRTATEDGDTKEGVLPVGQITGLIHDEPTVAELMERMVAEAAKQQQKLDAHFA